MKLHRNFKPPVDSQSAASEMSGSRDSLEERIANWLKSGAYREVEEHLACAKRSAVDDAFLRVFPLIFKEYVEVTEKNNVDGMNYLMSVLDDIVKEIDVQKRYKAAMEVYRDAHTLEAITYLLGIILEFLPDKRGVSTWDMKPTMLEELRNEALPFFLRRIRDFVQYEAYDNMDVLRASHLFIILFRNSQCSNLLIIDELLDSVVTGVAPDCERVPDILTTYMYLYRFEFRVSLPLKTLLFSHCLNDAADWRLEWFVQFLVYSPQHNLKRLAPVLLETLVKLPQNIHGLFHVCIVMRSIVFPLQHHVISREDLPTLIELVGRFFTESTGPNIDDMLRGKCLDVCRSLFLAFEPVALVLLVRRLIFQLWHNQYKEVLEPQLLAWLLDIYRRQLGSHPAYGAELGYIWGDIVEIKYQSLHDGVHFYSAVMLLAQYQALCRINKPLVKTVKEQILIPLSEKVADWSQLITTIRSDKREMATLPYLQTQVTETFKFVDAFLNESEDGSPGVGAADNQFEKADIIQK